MANEIKKNDPQQKNKKGFDSSVIDTEFAHEMGMPIRIRFIKIKLKKKKLQKMPVNIKVDYNCSKRI